METKTFEIEKVSYKRKEISKGIILGTRKNRGDLARKKYPIWAKVKSRYISMVSPQRKDFTVYIPDMEIDPGLVFELTEKDGDMKTTRLKVLEVGAGVVVCEIVSVKTWQPKIKKLEIVEGLTHEYVFGGAPVEETSFENVSEMLETAPTSIMQGVKMTPLDALRSFFDDVPINLWPRELDAFRPAQTTIRTDGFLFDIHPNNKENKTMNLFNLTDYTQEPAREVLRLTAESEPAIRAKNRLDLSQFPMFAPAFQTGTKHQAQTMVNDLPIFEGQTISTPENPKDANNKRPIEILAIMNYRNTTTREMDRVFKAYLACQNKEELDAVYLSCKNRDAQDMALTALCNETARMKEIAVKEESPKTQPNTMTDLELVNAYKQLKDGFTSYKFNVDAPEVKQMIALEQEMNRRGISLTYLLDDICGGLKTLRNLVEDDFSPVSALLELQLGDNWEGRQDAWQAILDAAVNAGIVTPEDIERAETFGAYDGTNEQRDAYAEIFLTPAPENDPPANYDERKQAFDEKRERRIDRLQTCAANAEKRSDQLWAAGHKLVENIPFGQPILVGHHSEKHHRRTIERAQNKSSQAVEEHKKADYYAARADAAENNHAISSDDPDACDKLQAKIDDAEKLQVMMVMINKIVRNKKLTDDQKIAQLIEQGIRLDVAQGALEKDYLGRLGIPAYTLQNNNANIRRMKDRLQNVKKQEARPAGEMEINGVRIVENDIENRVQIFFIGKPAENVRDFLKHNGFHWSNTHGAWQRMRSNVATRTAQEAAQMVNAE